MPGIISRLFPTGGKGALEARVFDGNINGPHVLVIEFNHLKLNSSKAASGASADAANCRAVSTAPVNADFLLPSLYAGKMGEAVTDMSLKDFCAQYKVGEDLFERLGQLGFTTVGSLLEVKDAELTDRGFNLGHILELKRALKQFVDRNRNRKSTSVTSSVPAISRCRANSTLKHHQQMTRGKYFRARCTFNGGGEVGHKEDIFGPHA
ncbi:hypothetical protein B0H16DRAFT_1463741 [Mycena metata]|uniref:SAM domain-containing protein n=1 Tax=Mycena metata TaxID=1033252 RepID=A0AAD7N314_9AGAR|nr:hypothetical protein B0H16DRAFT_1463741 [Mycena metata]